MTEKQLRKGIALAQAGETLEARNVLGQVVKSRPEAALGWLWLACVVETKEQQRYCIERILQLNPQNRAVWQILTQLQSETTTIYDIREEIAKPQVATSLQYFIGHLSGDVEQAAPEETEDLRTILARVFGSLGYDPYYADTDASRNAARSYEEQSLLLTICKKVFLTRFSVFHLSPDNTNVYLEMGIALGLNRPIVVIANEQITLPPVLRGHNIIQYTDLSDLEAKLSQFCEQGFPPQAQSMPDYCYFCGRVCASMSTPPDENVYLALNESKLLWRNLIHSLTPHLAQHHLYPIYLSDRDSGPMLCDVRRKVLASQFALCHLGALSDESCFLALGMAIGSRVPWILLAKRDHDSVPSNLQEIDRIEYASLADLEGPLTDTLGLFLGRIMAGLAGAQPDTKTALLSLPFWVQLDDWIELVIHDAQRPEAVHGSLRIIHYKGQKRLATQTIPERGLVLGRNPDCNVVVENPSASARHFRILKGRTGKYFIEDLQSKNGTFLNGVRLSPNESTELKPKDTIRIPGARFLVWDDRPLPQESPYQPRGDTGLLVPIPQIEIPDVPPPTYLSTWDHSMVMTVLLPDSRTQVTFEVQAYYPMGRILAALIDLLDLPDQTYYLRIEDTFIGQDETPLSIGIKKGDVLILVAEK
jgi:pSer/pThr/pTyr-binding forkhead associated (FHA) protein